MPGLTARGESRAGEKNGDCHQFASVMAVETKHLLMFAKYSVGAQRAAPALARHLLCPKTTLYSAGINNRKRIGWLYPIFRDLHFYHGLLSPPKSPLGPFTSCPAGRMQCSGFWTDAGTAWSYATDKNGRNETILHSSCVMSAETYGRQHLSGGRCRWLAALRGRSSLFPGLWEQP